MLAAVAAIAPAPGSTDRGFYERMGREVLIRDCADIHCFRPLVAAVLEHLPGPSLPKWKAYAVIANGVAALAVWRFCLILGLSASASIAAAWLSALGTGSLYSLFDPYTSDPLMYMVGPLMAIELWHGRTARAGWMAAVGLFAKEFAAAPLWIFTGMHVLARRWSAAARLLLVSALAMIVWLSKQTWLMSVENYRYGFTASVDLLKGGYIATWLDRVGVGGALMYLFTTFGAMYVLLPGGVVRAGRDLRLLALATIPAAIAFLYVEQPERALWNFHFVVVPLAVIALEGLPSWAIGVFVSASSLVGLRYGAQLDIRSIARVALVVALGIAVAAVAIAVRRRHVAQPLSAAAGPKPSATPARPRKFWLLASVEALAIVFLTGLLVDLHAHRVAETTVGVNQYGFRGPVRTAPYAGVRVAVVGGTATFDAGTMWWNTVAARLVTAIDDRIGKPVAWVDNLSEPTAGAETYIQTLRDYAYFHPDVVCVFDDGGGEPAHGRRRSLVFRATGYLPIVPSKLFGLPAPLSDAGPAIAPPADRAAIAATVRFALERGQAVVLAARSPDTVAPELMSERRFRVVNIEHETQSQDIAGRLADAIVDLTHETHR